MKSPTALNSVQEEYLAAALLLQEHGNHVSIATLAGHLQTHIAFAQATVEGLVKVGLLELSSRNGIRLTLEGRNRANDIERRRGAVARILSSSFHLDPLTAEQAARSLRPALSRLDVNRIMAFRHWHRQGASTPETRGAIVERSTNRSEFNSQTGS